VTESPCSSSATVKPQREEISKKKTKSSQKVVKENTVDGHHFGNFHEVLAVFYIFLLDVLLHCW
jgi:hypothetical protein